MQSFKQKKKMGKNKIKTALFGLGRIGQMHANNLRKNSDFKLKYVFDLNKNLSETKIKVKVNLASGGKCKRCWKIVPEVKDKIELCNRCTRVIKLN